MVIFFKKTIYFNKKRNYTMLYGTRELAQKWGVSSETVRRYLKKQGKSKDCDGTFFINEEELKNIEFSLNNKRCKLEGGFEKSRWKTERIIQEIFKPISLKIHKNKIFLKLLDENNQKWEALFCYEAQENREIFTRKLSQAKKIIVDGIKNHQTRRIVLKKIRRNLKKQRKKIF